MSITVREALQLPALKDAVLIAGAGGLDRVITSVNIMEVPDILRWVKKDELLVTTTYPIKDDPQAQASLIADLAGRALAALAIKPVWYRNEVPEVMIRQAEALAFPLIQLPQDASFDDIINPVLAEILNRQAAILRRNEEVHRRLTAIVLDGGSLVAIADTLASLLHLTVSIHSARLRLLALCTPIEDAEVQKLARDAEGLRTLLAGRTGRVPLDLDGRRQEVTVHPVTVARETYAYLILWPRARALRTAEQHAVEQAATVVALEITKLRAVAEVEQRFRSRFIEDLIHGRIVSRADAVVRAEEYGWDLSESFVPVLIRVETGAGSVEGPGSERAMMRAMRRLRDAVATTIAVRAPTSISVDTTHGTLILLRQPRLSGKGRAQDAASDFVRVIREEMADAGAIVSAGAGRQADDVMELPRGYRQALEALQVGMTVHGSGSVTAFDDLGIYRVLATATDRQELQQFCHEVLSGLMHARRRNHADLLATLEAVLRCDGNLRRAARELYVHYNTLRYRMARIRDLTGMDLRSAEDRLNLQVALKIHRMGREA